MAIQRGLVCCGTAILIQFTLQPSTVNAFDEEYAEVLSSIPDTTQLRQWHDLLGSEPHVAGTVGDRREIERIKQAFEKMGLQTEVHEFTALLPRPIEARLELIDAAPLSIDDGQSPRRGIIPLPITERELLEDPSVQHPGLTYGWNAYSGSGDVTADVVYVNYGTYEDFERLRELGVDPKGKILIARYGKNYRGYKVKYAQEAGAAGLLMYLDPADYGFQKGPTWPQGGWANASCIQRGSVLVLPYKGDPLTPFIEATAEAKRLDPDHVGMPWIPVQPIGYAAATRILGRMKGRVVEDEQWQGGLPFPYRLETGSGAQVRLLVNQDRRLRTSANVLATIKGTTLPDEFVVVGCHHDAWGFGAADPLAGTIVLMEIARAVAEAASRGIGPERTIIFAAWGAEVFGIIGSTEWVEGNTQKLIDHCVAYINLDMAAMGDDFSASASPVLRTAVTKALLSVPQSGAEDTTLRDTWAQQPGGPSFGDLGGGSDHVGFVCHVSVPSIRLGSGGAPGVSYHSNYDTLAWYRATVGESYDQALMVTRATAHVLAMLSDDPCPPYDWTTVWDQLTRTSQGHMEAARSANLDVDLAGLTQAEDRLQQVSVELNRALASAGPLNDAQRASIGRMMLEAERSWLDETGLPDRPWYRNLFISDDPVSGYAASVLPGLQAAYRSPNAEAFRSAVASLAIRVDLLADRLEALVKHVYGL
jgi:N-acetylated-alpha-linked acidic dipeptidase